MEETISEIQLPEQWSWVELKDLTENSKDDIVDGPFGSNLKSSEYTETGIPVFKIQNIKENRFVDKNINFVSPTKAEELSRHSFQKGDLIITKLGNPLGLCCKVPEKYPYGIIVADLMRFRPSARRVTIQYLMYGINSVIVQNQFKAITKGTTRPRVNLTIVRGIKFPLPPLPEQRAIVSKIEQLFSELDNGISNLKLAQEQLKVYRQAVLDKTTKTEKFVPINSIIDELGQGWSPKCHNEPSINNEEWGVIKTTAIQAGYFNESENKRLPANLEPRAKHELKAGDILITRAGPRVRVGVCCLVKKVRPRLINCDKAYRIRLKENLILPQFFEYTLNSPKYTRMMGNLKTGINDSGVNLTQNRFLDLEIPLPSLTEQQAIVQEIETRLSICDKIEQDIKENLEKAEALRQSILKKAFEGKLLNERELAEVRKAEDREPAEVLLEKIKALKEGKGKKGKQPTEKLKSVILDDRELTQQYTLEAFEQATAQVAAQVTEQVTEQVDK